MGVVIVICEDGKDQDVVEFLRRKKLLNKIVILLNMKDTFFEFVGMTFDESSNDFISQLQH